MYSYEDRLRAVRLYIKLGKRIGLTIRQLGYPTKNALKTWYREYEQHHDLPAGYTRQPKFSQAQKDRAVEHYLEHGQCIAATIKSLGYPCRALLSAWLQELHPQRKHVVSRSQELAPEAKQSAVIALCTRPASAQAVADGVGVSRGSLYKWKNQLLGHRAPASMKRKQDVPASSDRAGLEQQLETLRQDIRRLQLEKDLLKKANELLKKELGIDQQHLTNREKTQLVNALRPTYTVAELLGELKLPRSSYFYHRARLEVADKYADVRQAMINIFECNYRCYGYRRLHASLSDQCVSVSEKVVRRLMKQESLVARRTNAVGMAPTWARSVQPPTTWICPCIPGHRLTLRLMELLCGGTRAASDSSARCEDETRCNARKPRPGFASRSAHRVWA
jgi:transposase-like protein